MTSDNRPVSLHASSDPTSTWLVTGGAGFIGSNFVRHVLGCTPHRVVVVDALTYSGHKASLDGVSGDGRFEFVQADICERDAMVALFERVKPDAIVNFAAETHVDRSIDDPWPFVRTNVNGTCVLLEVARRYLQVAPPSARRHFRFLHVSTDEVYGSLGPEGLFHETTPYAPNSPYAASKASADHFVRAYYETYGLPVLLTNCSNNYGPYQFPEKLIPLMVLNAIDGLDLPIYGDGSNVRDWLYVEDHCAGIRLALQNGEAGARYNIGGNNEYSNLQLVDLLCDALEVLRPAHANERLIARGVRAYRDLKTFVDDRPGHDQRYAIDASRMRAELGWAPQVDLAKGLALTVDWYLGNAEWCASVQAGRYGRERLGLGHEVT